MGPVLKAQRPTEETPLMYACRSSQARQVAAAGREDFSGATRQLHRDEDAGAAGRQNRAGVEPVCEMIES